MSDFTYEFENKNTVLEKYEWDNTWLESTDVIDTPRILYIGDSISCATRRVVTSVAQGTVLVDGLGTSKAVDNPHFPSTIRVFAEQQATRAAILFNNGLHGWHLNDETEYKLWYQGILKFLLNEFEGTPIFLVLTTAVSDVERNKRVLARNKAVLELADENNLPVMDFYSITDSHRELISSDGVHLLEEGYELLAKQVLESLEDHLHANGM